MNGGLVLGERLVGIAIEPALARLGRCDDRVARGAGVLGRMTVRRTVAAMRPAAFLAGPQVDPPAADLHAFIAFMACRRLDAADGRKVLAFPVWHSITVTPWRGTVHPIWHRPDDPRVIRFDLGSTMAVFMLAGGIVMMGLVFIGFAVLFGWLSGRHS